MIIADEKLHVEQLDKIIIVSGHSLDCLQVDGTRVVVVGGRSVVDDLKKWLSRQSVSDAAKTLGIGQGTVGRLRRGLGLSEKYDKNSRTTKWRKKQ
ncbi:MAG: hypothetical protein DRI81_07190 [Chloroflexi bacterium]|nr:MAG: hypothetical protein DRI81_07190 [Chloroflexota bacterium]